MAYEWPSNGQLLRFCWVWMVVTVLPIGYDMFFIAELWFRDPTVTIWLESHERHTPEQLALAEHVYEFREGVLSVVK